MADFLHQQPVQAIMGFVVELFLDSQDTLRQRSQDPLDRLMFVWGPGATGKTLQLKASRKWLSSKGVQFGAFELHWSRPSWCTYPSPAFCGSGYFTAEQWDLELFRSVLAYLNYFQTARLVWLSCEPPKVELPHVAHLSTRVENWIETFNEQMKTSLDELAKNSTWHCPSLLQIAERAVVRAKLPTFDLPMEIRPRSTRKPRPTFLTYRDDSEGLCLIANATPEDVGLNTVYRRVKYQLPQPYVCLLDLEE
jgi:hypothetical protein